ncbi:MAG: HAD family hydrolase [Fervidicoccaceae archaeon]
MMFSGVTFDLWYTLIYETEQDEMKYQEMRLMAIKKALEEIGASFDEKILPKSFLHLRKFSLSIPYENFLKLLASSLGISLEKDQLEVVKQRYLEEIERYEIKLGPGVPEILEELKKKGLKTAIVSNTSFPEKALWKILGRKGVSQYLDAIVSSSDEGTEKPNPAIFQIAIKRIGVTSERSIHVGDSCIEDYFGSLAAGMKAILYTGLYEHRKEKTIHELCSLNSTQKLDSLYSLKGILL